MDDLSAAIASDVRVRIGPPAPTDEQLAMSKAVIDEQARVLGAALDRLSTITTPTA